MENMFLKIGMLIVTIIVIAIVMNFAMKSFVVEPLEKEQNIEGNSEFISSRINGLCDYCVDENLDKDCFIVDAQLTEGNLNSDNIHKGVVDFDVGPGKYVIKVSSVNSQCVVRKIV